jgi:hypothetical protein
MPSAICKADCIYRSYNKFKRLPSGRLVLNKGYRKQGRCQSVPEIGEKRACSPIDLYIPYDSNTK